MKWITGVVLILLSLIFVPAGNGEDLGSKYSFENKVAAPAATSTSELDHEYRMLVERNRLIQSAIIGIAEIVSLYVILFFVRRSTHSATHIVNASALILIVFGAILLSRFAETDQQLTAPIGILGAIAGYIFGTMRKGPEEVKPEKTI